MSVVPGWYPDPQRPGGLRYWSGTQWTSDVAEPSAANAGVVGSGEVGPAGSFPVRGEQQRIDLSTSWSGGGGVQDAPVPTRGPERKARRWWSRPAVLVPLWGNAFGLLAGALADGVAGILVMAMLGLLLGGLWHLVSGRRLPGIAMRPRPLGGALLGGSFVLLIAIGLSNPTPPIPAAASPTDREPATTSTPSPSSTPTPTPTLEDLADPDDVAVAASSLTPGVPPAVDVDTVLANAGGQTALATLTLLTVAEPAAADSYERDLFGYRAYDIDRNGCDTRNDILRRDLMDAALKDGTNGCVVASGTLDDPYSGTEVSFLRGVSTSADVQIDHVVSLKDAWVHGAATWSDTQRHQFGNDPLNLLAVEGAMNQQKGDDAADAWLPPNTSFDCTYVARQVGVKYTYGLSVTAPEKAAMTGVLSTCPDQSLPDGVSLPPVVTSAVQVAAEQEAAAQAEAQAAADAAAQAAAQAAADQAAADAAAAAEAALDPRFGTCKAAIAAGYGPYYVGVDPEYSWYRDADHDGVDCER